MRVLWLSVLSLAVAGCATVRDPLPPGYVGPTASVLDTWSLDANERDQVFAVLTVDDVTINNAISETIRASHGRGAYAALRDARRQVPAKKLKLKVRGTHFSAAPIAEMARRAVGTFQSVEGTVELVANANAEYRVTGELSKAKSCVWIEEVSTKTPATEKVCSQ